MVSATVYPLLIAIFKQFDRERERERERERGREREGRKLTIGAHSVDALIAHALVLRVPLAALAVARQRVERVERMQLLRVIRRLSAQFLRSLHADSI